MPGKYQHSEKPKPPADRTNALVEHNVAKFNGAGQTEAVKELAPVPETHPGGLYRTAQGLLVNAHGEPVTVAADGLPLIEGDDTTSLEELVRELGSNNPFVQKKLAQRAARDRVQAARAVAAPQLPADQQAAQEFAKRGGKKAKPKDDSDES